MTLNKCHEKVSQLRQLRVNTVTSGHGHLMGSGVSPGDPVEQLPLNVEQKPRGPDPEHVVVEPGVPELLLDQD